jgi:hypothetical protein
VTLGAPHLVAAANLGDADPTGWASTGLLPDKRGRCLGFFGTSVRNLFGRANDLEAIRAGVQLANLALVLGGEEPSAGLGDARHNELLALRLLGSAL